MKVPTIPKLDHRYQSPSKLNPDAN